MLLVAPFYEVQKAKWLELENSEASWLAYHMNSCLFYSIMINAIIICSFGT